MFLKRYQCILNVFTICSNVFKKKLMYFKDMTKYVEGILMYINVIRYITCGSIGISFVPIDPF
jgi:hypothetical protein